MEKLDLSSLRLGNVDSLTKKAIDGLKNDPVVYETISKKLGLTAKEVKSNLATLLNYQEDVHYCASCQGLDKCNKSRPFYQISLEKEGNLVVTTLSPCKEILKEEERENRFFTYSFPKEYLDNKISSIDAALVRKDAIASLAYSSKGKNDSWVYLYGSTRSGKTYILATFATSFASTHKGCAFVSSPELFEHFKNLSYSSKEDFDKYFGRIKNAPLLVLDDFGNEYKTEYSFSSYLLPILDYRNKKRLRTYFGSSFSLDEIETLYKDKIGTIYARQLKDILKRNCGSGFDISSSLNLY